MNKDELLSSGKIVIDYLQKQSFRPKELIRDLTSSIGEDDSTYLELEEYWNNNGKLGDFKTPVLISRGWDDIIPQEQILHYLPEEKLLINKDIFRSKLEGVDLTSISGEGEKKLMEDLLKEAIGLSKNDVLLYYNLLKINQISVKSRRSETKEDINNQHSKYLFNLLSDGFNLNLPEEESIKIILKNLSRGKTNPMVITLAAGRENDKFFIFLKDFLQNFILRRGDNEEEILRYIGLYILFNGVNEEELVPLNLTSNEVAFITDRIGRVRSVYYTLVLFIHTFNLLISAQVYEVSTKYLEADTTQKEKLKKLYWDDNRRKLLFTNALGIATRKISSNKSDTSEILGAFKRFTSKIKVFISREDLFEVDYRG